MTEALKAFRVVSVTGARQVGKTTLVKRLCAATGRRYVTFEDPVARSLARADPDAWLSANVPPLAIDEVQHVPEIFRAIKRRVDEDNSPGQYLITGSALWLRMDAIGESLAGRAVILEMFPFRPCEWCGGEWSWDWPLAGRNLLALRPSQGMTESDVWASILRGGYPEPAALKESRLRRDWFESYLRTYLQRDVLDLAHIERMAEFTRLIRLLAAQTGAIANQSALARDLGLPQPTVRRHMQWLQTTYQSHLLAPYSTNVGKRLVKTPKLYWSDTGMAAALSGWTSRAAVEQALRIGGLIETWVLNDMQAWVHEAPGTTLSFWRSSDGCEVDALIEKDGVVVGVEVKAGQRIDARDLRGLRQCREALGSRFRHGVVLYGGSDAMGLEDRLTAIPLTWLLGCQP